METPKNQQKSSLLTIFGALIAAAVVFNLLFIFLTLKEAKTIGLLHKELINLEQNAQIINSSQQIYDKYKGDIEVISAVFPTEQSIPQFISTLESQIRASADEYTFKFNSITPISENTTLYLPLTITMKTDLARLLQFFENLEHLPYMTHITSVFTKSPAGIIGLGETTVALKVYVQNPFTYQ